MQFHLENKWHGRFFTPWHIAELMAKMVVGDDLKEKKLFLKGMFRSMAHVVELVVCLLHLPISVRMT